MHKMKWLWMLTQTAEKQLGTKGLMNESSVSSRKTYLASSGIRLVFHLFGSGSMILMLGMQSL